MALLDPTVNADLRRSPRTAEVERGLSVSPPGLAAVMRRVGMNLLVACLVPAVLFYALFVTLGIWPAIIGALAWSFGAIAFRAATGRRPSGMLLLTTTVLTVRTVVALLAHSTFVYFLQPVVTDLVIGSVFLLSLLTATPVVARLAGDFYPLHPELAERAPMRQLFRRLTLLWALTCLLKATVVFWLLLSQPMSTFVLVRSVALPVTNLVVVGLTVLAAIAVARREGLLGHGGAQATWAMSTS
jgi:intracellular septation protein A